MEAFPHQYSVRFESASTEPELSLESPGLPSLVTAPPAEFGGPGTQWSPETLLVGAVASCFALSFRAVADASKFEWRELACSVEGTLDRVDRVTRFTRIALDVQLTIDSPDHAERAERLLHKAEEICLITNSLSAEVSFTARVKAL